MPLPISEIEFVSMGFDRCGWKLPEFSSKENRKIYGFGVWLIPHNQSIYCINCKTDLSAEAHAQIYQSQDYLIDASRRVIVDTLQENIRRYYQSKPLIPLEFILVSLPSAVMGNDPLSELGGGFLPSFVRMTEKQSAAISPVDKDLSSKEIRLIYKLMEEAPDDTIKKLMKEMVFLKEYKDTKYNVDGSREDVLVDIENPWDNSALTGAWQNRRRTADRPTYSRREPDALPAWLKAIMKFREDCEKDFKVRRPSLGGISLAP